MMCHGGSVEGATDTARYGVRVGEFDHIVEALQASPITTEFAKMAEANDFSRLDKSAAKRHVCRQLCTLPFLETIQNAVPRLTATIAAYREAKSGFVTRNCRRDREKKACEDL